MYHPCLVCILFGVPSLHHFTFIMFLFSFTVMQMSVKVKVATHTPCVGVSDIHVAVQCVPLAKFSDAVGGSLQ